MKIDGFDKFVSLGKDNADALVKSSTIAFKGFEDIAKAWQALATKNVERTDAVIKAVTACKSPVEFADLQSKLVRESVESSISEGRKIAELTQATFTAALEPLNARFAEFQVLAKTAA